MLKTTFKLDAICAKLSKGRGSGLPPQEEPCTGAALPGSNTYVGHHDDREACKPDINATATTMHNGGMSVDGSAQLPMLQATDNGYIDSELSMYAKETDHPGREDGGDDSRCSSPKVLSGASKRKSRQRTTRVAVSEVESASGWESSSVHSFHECEAGSLDSGVVGSHQDDQMNGLEHWEDDQEERDALISEQSQEQGHNSGYESQSTMQNDPYTNSPKALNGNNNKVGQADLANSSKEAEKSAYTVAGHELRKRSSGKVPVYDESGLSDEEGAAKKATYDPRAIMEYAERSWCNDNGTEIEEGLETSDVICDVEDASKRPAGQGPQDGKPRRRRGRPSQREQPKSAAEDVAEEERQLANLELVGREDEDEAFEADQRREVEQQRQGEEPMEADDEDEEEEEVEYVEDSREGVQETDEAMPAQSRSPTPGSSHPVKEVHTGPAPPYDVEGLEAVKEYASDTMKEFLGMYGYMEDGSAARVEDLPLDHLRHVLELQRRHAEKKRASAFQRLHQQSITDRPDDAKRPESDHHLPQASAFSKLPSEPKEASLLRDAGGRPIAPGHAVLQHLAALHHQLRAEESALASHNGKGGSRDGQECIPDDAASRQEDGEALPQHPHVRHLLGRELPPPHPLSTRSQHPDSDPSQASQGGKDHLESLREAAEGGIPDLLAAPHPGVLAAHLEGRLAGSRVATGKTVKQLIEEQEFMRNLIELGDRSSETKRFSKYDYFIQKLEAGESISKDVPNLRVSKYDSYIRKLKAGQSINNIIGRKVSASQRIRDIISHQIQLKQGGTDGHSEESRKEEAAAAQAALEEAMLEREALSQQEIAVAAAAAAAGSSAASTSASGSITQSFGLDPSMYPTSNYEYLMSKFAKAKSAMSGMPSPYANLEGMASTSGSGRNSTISPPLGSDDHAIDVDDMDDKSEMDTRDSYDSYEYESRDNILKRRLLETGRSDLDSEEGSEKGIKSGTLSTSSSPGLEGSAFNRYIARFGASQDCGRCSYQFKEHYHCVDKDCKFAPGCHKVYTSTSDVLTHENFHKKNFTLLSDGFQRFRATEDCGTPRCTFYGQKTTHFHCRRPDCDFVFKNKCDIEKHKTFHMKDDIYRKDGFRKFSKHESCKFEGCRYSNTLNHFHCIRNGCTFTFTAANQMHSHKRKHERRLRMMEYETGRHFMRSIRPKMKLPLPRVNPTYRSLHGTPQMPLGEKPHMMPPCPAIIFKSDPGAASIAERAALAGQSASLGVSQTSPLAGQVIALPSNSVSRPDIQAIQPSVITSAPPSSTASTGSFESSGSHSAFERVTTHSPRLSSPNMAPATSVITNTSAAASEYDDRSDDSASEDKPMDLQVSREHQMRDQQPPVELDSADDEEEDDQPTDLSMREDRYQYPSEQGQELEYSREEDMDCERDFDREQEMSQEREQEGEDERENLPAGFARIAQMDKDNDKEGEDLNDSLNLPIASFISPPDTMPSKDGAEEMTDEAARSTSPVVMVKKEPRDAEPRQEEAWQKYFRRYTANDHCHSSCELLYKGHYHCIVEGCGEYFRSKEGVNKHTRYHLMSEEAAELGFQYFQHGQSCEDVFKGCPFSPLAHYHCMWSLKPGSYCGEVVHTGSSLMKPHYEKHHQNPELEAIRHAEVEKQAYIGTPINQVPPKVVLKDQTMKWYPQPPPVQPDDKGYCDMAPGKCNKPECPLTSQHHFHCTRSECNFATESPDMLQDHKSNEKLIFDSFRQFNRKLDCRRPGCKYNLLHKHYHCMHQGCQFSFLQIQQMESHGRKHMRRIYGKFFNRPNNNSPTGPQQLVLPILPLNNNVNNSGSPPGNAFSSPPGPGGMSSPLYQIPSMVPMASSSPHAPVTSSPVVTSAGGIPLHSMFLPSSMHSVLAIPQPGMPTSPLMGMGGTSPKPPHHQFLVPLAPLDPEDAPPSTSTHPENPGIQVLPNFQLGRWKIRQSSVISPPRSSPPTPHKRPLTLVVEDPGAPSGYKRYKRGPLDSSMQERFERFERNMHCGESSCQFAMNTTHYHCRHNGCNYKFAGKTMMYKHAQHHDRVDSIIQDDFQRFKASVSCDRSDCEYTAKNTHFHCLRCPFICTDSGKVPIHRKQHAKTEAVSAAGFKQFSSSEKCIVEDCKYSQKYSHFHCVRPGCLQAVIGMTQMDSHSRKHRL